MLHLRFPAVVILCCICGCGSQALPELRTSYDGAGPYSVTSNDKAHVAVLGDQRFVVSGTTIKSNGVVLTRFPTDTAELHVKKSAEGEITVLVDGVQVVPQIDSGNINR